MLARIGALVFAWQTHRSNGMQCHLSDAFRNREAIPVKQIYLRDREAIPVKQIYTGKVKIMATDILQKDGFEEENRVLRQRDENPLKPVHSNMVENVREDIIQAYEAALEANDRDVTKRMEWEFSTIGIYKKELKDYVARRRASRERSSDASV